MLVPENKLSLAIGKGGHNVRLAAKLTGYKIDVKPTTSKETPKSNDVLSTNSANIILDDDFFSDMPVLSTSAAETAEPEKKQETLVDQTEQNRFSRMRQINALRMEMKKAVREENFERAAELRDEIRKLEDTKESA